MSYTLSTTLVITRRSTAGTAPLWANAARPPTRSVPATANVPVATAPSFKNSRRFMALSLGLGLLAEERLRLAELGALGVGLLAERQELGVVDFRGGERVAKRAEAVSVPPGGRRIAARRGAEGSREYELRLGLWEAAPRELLAEELEPRRVRPATPLEGVTRRNRRQREPGHEVLDVDLGELAHLVDHTLGRRVLGRLEIGVGQVVERVQLIEVAADGVDGGAIGLDGLPPEPPPREDVGRHVERVRRGWRDRGVTPRGGEPLLGDRRVIVAVDQIVRDTRMLRLRGEHLLEDPRGLELVGVRLVRRERGRVERQGVEDRRLAIVRVARGELLHRLPVAERAGPVVYRVGVLVEGLDRRNIVTLALGLGARGLRALDGRPAVGERLRRRRPAEGIAQEVHRHAPVGDPAAGVGLGDGRERGGGRGEPERVEHGDGALEISLDRGTTRRREVDRADLVLGSDAARAERQQHGEGEGQTLDRHGSSSG